MTNEIEFNGKKLKKLSLRERFTLLDKLKKQRREALIANLDAIGAEKDVRFATVHDFDNQPVRLSDLITQEGQLAVAELREYADLPISDEESLQLTADLCGLTLVKNADNQPEGGAEGKVPPGEPDPTALGYGQ